ncbi:MAG TPA: hypothetical protein VIQ28_08140 [Burkholderiales bacterium]
MKVKTNRLNGWAVLADFAGTLGLALAGGIGFSIAAGAVIVMIVSG